MSSPLPSHYRNWPLWARLVHASIRLYCRFFHRLRSNRSSLPAEGPAILVANHLSSIDPLFLIATNRRIISFMIAAEYYSQWGLKRLYDSTGAVAVDRRYPTTRPLRAALKRLAAGYVVGIFPEGGIHPPNVQGRPKRGVALLALESGASVIPAQITGTKQIPGRIIWTFLRPRRVRLTYGPPVPLDDLRQGYRSCGDHDRWLNTAAERIFEAIHAL